MTKSEVELVWDRVLGPSLLVVAVLIGALIVRWFAHRVVDRLVRVATERREERLSQLPWRAGRVLANATGLSSARHAQRTATLGSVLKSIVSATVFTIALLTVMGIIGVPLGPVLTSAGIGGVAVGFGAQSLVKDFLSGVFMIVEDQYGVGDVIDTGKVTGTVEEVSLRVTRVRDSNGVVWYVRNGEIIQLGNNSQGWSTATVDLPLSFHEDLDRVTVIIEDALAGLTDDDELATIILADPEVIGIQSLTGGVLTVRIQVRCAATENGPVERAVRERIKTAFDAAGIVLATPPPTWPSGAPP